MLMLKSKKWYFLLSIAVVACNGSVLVPSKKQHKHAGDPGAPTDPGDPTLNQQEAPSSDPGLQKGKGKKNRFGHNSDNWDNDDNMDHSDIDKGDHSGHDHDGDYEDHRPKKKRKDFLSEFNQEDFENKRIRGIITFERKLNAGGLRSLKHRGYVRFIVDNFNTRERVEYASEPTEVSYAGDNPEGILEFTKLMPVSQRHGSNPRFQRPLYIDGYHANKAWNFRLMNENGEVIITFSSMRF